MQSDTLFRSTVNKAVILYLDSINVDCHIIMESIECMLSHTFDNHFMQIVAFSLNPGNADSQSVVE